MSYVNYTAAEGVTDGEKIPYEQTDFAQDSKRGYDYMETIYLWEPGQVEFQYDENGILKKADYQHSPWTHATTDCSGTIAYDEKGRMIYNDYYITHGGHTDIFLYKENSNLPWVCLNWCSFGPGLTGIILFKEGGNAY